MDINKRFGLNSKPTVTRLISALNNSKIAVENNPLYQVVFGLIKNSEKFEGEAKSALTVIQNTISGGGGGGTPVIPGLTNLSYVTVNGEQGTLPNSRQLSAGANITLTNNGNTLEISAISEVVDGYWTLLTDGDVDETDFIFVDGDPISIFVPL